MSALVNGRHPVALDVLAQVGTFNPFVFAEHDVGQLALTHFRVHPAIGAAEDRRHFRMRQKQVVVVVGRVDRSERCTFQKKSPAGSCVFTPSR